MTKNEHVHGFGWAHQRLRVAIFVISAKVSRLCREIARGQYDYAGSLRQGGFGEKPPAHDCLHLAPLDLLVLEETKGGGYA